MVAAGNAGAHVACSSRSRTDAIICNWKGLESFCYYLRVQKVQERLRVDKENANFEIVALFYHIIGELISAAISKIALNLHSLKKAEIFFGYFDSIKTQFFLKIKKMPKIVVPISLQNDNSLD